MATLKLFQEFGVSKSLAVLEPSNKCMCKCTFCYAEINRRIQSPGKTRVTPQEFDDGSFERTCNKVFSTEYDPADFLQWQLHERVPFVFASGVEPLQDMDMATGILGLIRTFDLAVYLETRALNWRPMWPMIKPLASNLSLYVSLPSLDPTYIKAFEPGTPPITERRALIEAAVEAGISVAVAINPYHPDWCPDLVGMIVELEKWGVDTIVLDALRLSHRQKKVISEHGGDKRLLAKVKTIWTDSTVAQWREAEDACRDLGLGLEVVPHEGREFDIRDVEPADPWPFANATLWPYLLTSFVNPMLDLWDEDETAVIACTFEDAMTLMEQEGVVEQPFTFTSMSGISQIRDLKDSWKKVIGKQATIREYLRALWNDPDPSGNGFPWMHTFVRIAVRPDGTPWLDGDGNLIMAFDPVTGGKTKKKKYEYMENFRRIKLTEESETAIKGY